MASPMKELGKTSLAELVEEKYAKEVIVISRLKSDVVIPIKNKVIIIPTGLPTPLTDQASLVVLATSADLQRYLFQKVLVLLDPESVPAIYLKSARKEVAKANNTSMDETELNSVEDLLEGGLAVEKASPKLQSENAEIAPAAEPLDVKKAGYSHSINMINNMIKTENFDDAESELIKLVSKCSPEDQQVIFAEVEPCEMLESVKKQLA